MADISRIKIESGEYDIKDAVAREKLDKSILFFNSIDELKNSTNLKKDSIVKTIGFYEANDGGGAFYRITDDSTIVSDDIFIHQINNTDLKAELIVENNTINILSLGARRQTNTNTKYDIQPFILAYISYLNNFNQIIKLYIPRGFIYVFSM